MLTINLLKRDFNAVVHFGVNGYEDLTAPTNHNLRGTQLYVRPDGRHVFQIEYWWHGQMIVSTVGHKSPDLEESFVRAAEDNDVKINFI